MIVKIKIRSLKLKFVLVRDLLGLFTNGAVAVSGAVAGAGAAYRCCLLMLHIFSFIWGLPYLLGGGFKTAYKIH